ncbi:MAG: hypothetical protein M3308_02635 [Actinomycetota bacterium]|nr:hypothetical protein [Actinomycetota bacterium]
MAYIVPIVARVLREGSGKGIADWRSFWTSVASCSTSLTVLGGAVLVSLPSWRRLRRPTRHGRHHRRDPLRPAGTAAPGAGDAR